MDPPQILKNAEIHERFSILCPCILSNSSSKWHETLRYDRWVKILVPLKKTSKLSVQCTDNVVIFYTI